jgi:hypothetical protein
MNRIIDRPVTLQRLAIDFDLRHSQVDLGTQLRDSLTIDLNAPLLDQLVAVAARPKSSLGKESVQPNGPNQLTSRSPGGWSTFFLSQRNILEKQSLGRAVW